MTKLIVTYDELAKKYLLISGNNRVNLHTQKIRFMGSLAGKSIVLEKEIPISLERKLNIGPQATVRINIQFQNDLEEKITAEEFWLLSTLFDLGIVIVKEKIEMIVSRIKINFAQYNYDSIYLNNIIMGIYDGIINIMASKIDSELANLSKYMQITINSSPNISPLIDKALDEKSKQRLDLVKTFFDVVKDNPYPPQTLADTYDQFLDIANKKLPSLVAPSDEEMKKAYQILFDIYDGIINQNLLGKNNSPKLLRGK